MFQIGFESIFKLEIYIYIYRPIKMKEREKEEEDVSGKKRQIETTWILLYFYGFGNSLWMQVSGLQVTLQKYRCNIFLH